ncbi:MAG: alpha/beta fold hydrolase [bacterium]
MRIALALSALLLLRPAWADTPPAPLEYLVRIVGGADAPDLPLVIAVHGLGDRPESFIGLLDGAPFRARVLAPRAPVPYGRGGTWFALADPPDDRMRAELAESADRLAALAAHARARWPQSPGVWITGFSQGGMLSFAVAARHPEAVAGAVPIAGALPPPIAVPARVPPIRALHGEADRRIPFAAGQATVAALASAGDVRLQAFPGVGHAVPPPVRAALFATLAGLLPALASK